MAIAEFEKLRQRAKMEAQANAQQAGEAMQRRFARQGMLGSGAAIKQESLAQERALGEGVKSVENIGLAEQQEEQRRAEIEGAKQFQMQEAEKQRGFITSERGAQELFQKGLIADQQAFQREQNKFASEEAAKQRDFASGQANIDRKQQYDLALKQLGLSAKGLKLEADAQKFNKELAKWQQGQPTDLLGQLLGPGFSTQNIGKAGGALEKVSGGAIKGGSIGGTFGGALGGATSILGGKKKKKFFGLF